MKNKKRQNNTNAAISFFVVILCLAGALSSAYMFYRSLNTTLTRTGGKIQGKVIWKNRAVQRRFSDRFVWGSVTNGSDVYEGDIIRTDTNSDASILLSSDTSIDMAENTLIQITTDKWGRINLNLLGGGTTVKTKSETILVNHGKRQVELKSNTQLRADVKQSGNESSFMVDSGNATITSGDVKQEINSGTSLNVNSNGTITDAKPVVVQSITPSVQQIKTVESNIPVDLQWKSNGDSVRLEVASDSRFSNIAISRIQKASNAQITLPPGFWWWRITPIEAEDKSSADGKIIITLVDEQKKITEPVASPVVFSFLTAEKPVSTVKEINRIQAAIENKPETVQPAVPVQAAKTEPPPTSARPLPPPRLLTPDIDLDPAAFKDSRNVRFSWSAVPGAIAYLWTLQHGTLQTSVVVRETAFIYDASRIENGTYIWRVEALRNIPASYYVSERGTAAERNWNVRIPLPQKPVLLKPVQEDSK